MAVDDWLKEVGQNPSQSISKVGLVWAEVPLQLKRLENRGRGSWIRDIERFGVNGSPISWLGRQPQGNITGYLMIFVYSTQGLDILRIHENSTH